MATVNALSVALFNAAAGGYAAEMTANAAGFANAVGPILEKDVSTDALFVDHLLGNLGVTSTNAVYAQAKAAVAALVTTKGRAGAAVDAIDFLKAQEGSTSAYATIAADFAAKVNTAATFTAANATERDITKLVSGVTGVDTDAAAIAAATAAAEAAAATAAAAAATKAAADLAAANAAAEAAATAAAAALAAAEAEAAADLAAANAAAEAAATAAAAALAAAEAEAAADLAAANATITALQNPTGASTTLTATANTVLGVAGGNDTITAASATLGSSDVIVDSSATDSDVLNLALTADLTATPVVIGVERINATFTGWTATGGGVGATTLEIAADSIGATHLDVATSGTTAVTAFKATNVADGTQITSAAQFTSVTVDTDDEASVTLNTSARSATTTSTVAVASAAGATEGVTVRESVGSVSVTASDAVGELDVTAVQDVTVDSATATSAVITAGDDVTITSLAAAETVTITAGDDVAGGSDDLDAATSVTVTAGGKVTLDMDVAESATITAVGVYSSLDDQTTAITGDALTTLNLRGNGGALDVTATGADLLDTIAISGNYAVQVNLDINDVEELTSTGLTLTNSGTATAELSLTGSVAAGKDLVLKNVATSTNIVFTGTLNQSAGDLIVAASGANLIFDAAVTAALIDGVTATAETNSITLTVDKSTSSTSTYSITSATLTDFADVTLNVNRDTAAVTIGTLDVGTGDLVINAGANAVTLSTAIDAGTVTLTGSGDYTLSDNVDAALLDASAVTGDVTVESDGTTSETSIILTGSGDDVITTVAAADFNLTAGAGDDTVIIDGADFSGNTLVVDFGAGDDTLELDSTANISGTAVSITGFENIVLNGDVTVQDTLLDAQTYNISDTAAGAVVVTIAVSQATNDFSDLDLAADSITSADSFVIDASALTTATTIVGTSAADTITGADTDRAKADVLSGGAGADTFIMGEGGDTINGGTGTDTVNVAALKADDVEDGSSDSTGVIVNLSTSSISNTTVAANFSSFISGGITSISAGGVGYLFSSSSTSNSSTVGSLTSVENVTGSAGADYIVGSSADNTISAGAGADYINGGAGNDTIDLGTTDTNADTVVFAATAATNGSDTITHFETTVDKLNVDALTTQTATTAATAETFTTTAGKVYFFSASDAGAALSVETASTVATVVNASATITSAAVTAFLIVVDETEGNAAIYQWVDTTGTAEIGAAELTLMGTIDATLVTGDIVFS